MSTSPYVTKVTSLTPVSDWLPSLPVGFPVEVVRDFRGGFHPYRTEVWVHYFGECWCLGTLPDPMAVAVGTALEAGHLVSGRLLTYMRASATLPPVVTVHLQVRPPSEPP